MQEIFIQIHDPSSNIFNTSHYIYTNWNGQSVSTGIRFTNHMEIYNDRKNGGHMKTPKKNEAADEDNDMEVDENELEF